MAISGTVSAIQRICYWEHKPYYCLKYQTKTAPNALLISLYGLKVGRLHDTKLFQDRWWNDVSQEDLLMDGVQLHVYDKSTVRMISLAYPKFVLYSLRLKISWISGDKNIAHGIKNIPINTTNAIWLDKTINMKKNWQILFQFNFFSEPGLTTVFFRNM